MAEAEALTREEIRSRRISTEDMIRHDLLELHRIRRDVTNPHRVTMWSEGLEAFADLLRPWANDASDKGQFWKEWEERPMRLKRIPHPSGDDALDRLVPNPTATDCRKSEQIIMGLLDRANLLVKRRTISGPPTPPIIANGTREE